MVVPDDVVTCSMLVIIAKIFRFGKKHNKQKKLYLLVYSFFAAAMY